MVTIQYASWKRIGGDLVEVVQEKTFKTETHFDRWSERNEGVTVLRYNFTPATPVEATR